MILKVNLYNKLLPLFFVFVFLLSSCEEASKSGQENMVPLPDPLAAGWQGASVCELIEENEAVRVLKCTFPPGVGHERHYHPKHFGYTLKGGKFRITDTTGTREVNIPTGFDFFNEVIAWHEVLNIGIDTAVFLIMEPK
ncbi:MAG: quercetin dioxygenase-like cupin family protein [Marivirga sp.]|jgi:quercetin dioxygenase-like cupin family protein